MSKQETELPKGSQIQGPAKRKNQVTAVEIAYRLFNYPAREALPAVLAYLAAFLVLGALIGNFGAFLGSIGQWLGPVVGWHAPTALIAQATNGLILPVLLFVGVYLFARWIYSRPVQKKREFMPPPAHRGLILNLSLYNARGDGPAFDDLKGQTETATSVEQFRSIAKSLRLTNYGHLVSAFNVHESKLEYVWILCTSGEKGTETEFPTVMRLLQGLKPGLHVDQVHGDAVDVQKQVAAVKATYFIASSRGLGAEDIVADFTGGTAAMSIGMALAALDRDRKLQYSPQQDPPPPPVLIETSRELVNESG